MSDNLRRMFSRAASLALLMMIAASLPAQTEAPACKGKVERIKVHGRSLERNLSGDSPDRDVSVYLPPSYAKNAKRRFPVIYFLHGFTDSDDRWFGGPQGNSWSNLAAAADKGCTTGLPEMIIVMPNSLTRFLISGYSASVTTGDWETFTVRELVAYMDSHYRTIPGREARGLAGHSLGGYGALRLGYKYPDVYSSLYALSTGMPPNLNPSIEDGTLAEAIGTPQDIEKASGGVKRMLFSSAAWSPNPQNPPFYIDLPIKGGKQRPEILAEWAANSLLAMVHQYVFNLRRYKAIAFDVGDKDVNIPVENIKSFDRILTDYGIQHAFELYEGDHFNRIQERLESKVLPFFAHNLSFNVTRR